MEWRRDIMIYFIVNTTGGSGRAMKTWRVLREILAEEAIEFKAYRTKKPGDAGRIARGIAKNASDMADIVIVGGDGTFNEVLNGIPDLTRVRLGLIPCGSGNDFARGLDIPKDVKKAWHRIRNAGEGRRIDIGEVALGDETHRFGISAGIGLDAIVCRKVSRSSLKPILNRLGLGQLTYLVVTVISLFTMKKTDMKLVMRGQEDALPTCEIRSFKDVIFLAAMNMPAEGGGVRMTPQARCDDGAISLCSAHGIPRWKSFFLLPPLARGKHPGKKGFYLAEGEEVILSLGRPMTVHADGEYLGEHDRVGFRIVPGALIILNPETEI